MVFASCRRSKSPSYDAEWLAPLAHASLTIDDILPDSLTQHNPDHTIDLRYQHSLFKKTVNEMIVLPDTALTYVMNLKDMTLSDNTMVHTLSLGQLCEQGGIAGATVIANHGSMLAIPSISTTNANSTDIDLGSLFKSAQIQEGQMEIDLTNNFPVEMQDFIFRLENKSDKSTVIQDTFKVIQANGGRVVHRLSLAGKKVEGLMTGTVLNLYSPGSGSSQVLIDTAATSVFKITIKGMKVSSITAVFPQKELINFQHLFNFKKEEAQLKNIEFDTALMELTSYSTFGANLKLDLQFPQVTKNSKTYKTHIDIAQGSQAAVKKSVAYVDWAGYYAELSGPDGNQTNYLTMDVSAFADSTGIPVTISEKDYIKFELRFKKLAIKKAVGYFGQSKLDIDEKQTYKDIFRKIVAGKFILGKIKTSFLIENSIGTTATIKFDQLDFYGHDTMQLTGSVFSKPYTIGRGIYYPNSSVRSFFDITESNSNITSVIESKPTGFHIKASGITNPNGNVYNYGDFLYGSSYIKVGLDIQMPVQVVAQGLQMVDTIKYNFPHLDQGRKVKEGILRLMVDNAFPVEAKIKIYVLGSNKQVIDSFFTQSPIIASGVYNNNNPAYCNPTKSVLEEYANVDELVALKQGYYIVVSAWVNTKSGTGALYDTYFLDVKVAADVLYETKL